MTAVSFRPLSRNRYRCTVTGTLLKKAGLDAHRRRMAHRDRPARLPKPKPAEHNVVVNWREECHCPTCSTLVYGRPGTSAKCTCGSTLHFSAAAVRRGWWRD